MIGYWYFLYIILTSHCIILGMKSDILTNERKNALACPIQTVCDILWFFWNLHDFSILKNKHLKVPRFLYTLHTYSNKIIPSGETWTIGLHLDRWKFFWLFFAFFFVFSWIRCSASLLCLKCGSVTDEKCRQFVFSNARNRFITVFLSYWKVFVICIWWLEIVQLYTRREKE